MLEDLAAAHGRDVPAHAMPQDVGGAVARRDLGADRDDVDAAAAAAAGAWDLEAAVTEIDDERRGHSVVLPRTREAMYARTSLMQ
jgi:hypothetical protein